MSWTTTPPAKPGKYYWRASETSRWTVFEVDNGGRLGLMVECEKLKDFGGEWGGEVPGPEEVEGMRREIGELRCFYDTHRPNIQNTQEDK